MRTFIKLSLLLVSVLSQTVYAVNCGDNIASNVVFTRNLECNSGYTGLEVVNSNVTIDLNGFTLSGPSELSGINISEHDNVVIKNGSIKGFWAGVNSINSDKLNISNLTFYEVGHGVIVNQGNNARIRNNDFIKTTSSAVSISVRAKGYSANKNLISQNEFYRTKGAITICGDQADQNIIADNLIWKNTDYGIHLNHSDRNQIYRNRILESSDLAAVRLNNSSYNNISNNTILEGAHAGVSILGNAGEGCLDSEYGFSGKNQLAGNQVSGFSAGVILGLGDGSERNVDGTALLNNRINDNEIGVFLNSDTRNSYGRGNSFFGNTSDVIDHGVNNRL